MRANDMRSYCVTKSSLQGMQVRSLIIRYRKIKSQMFLFSMKISTFFFMQNLNSYIFWLITIWFTIKKRKKLSELLRNCMQLKEIKIYKGKMKNWF